VEKSKNRARNFAHPTPTPHPTFLGEAADWREAGAQLRVSLLPKLALKIVLQAAVFRRKVIAIFPEEFSQPEKDGKCEKFGSLWNTVLRIDSVKSLAMRPL
jgi:hypothetical protein